MGAQPWQDRGYQKVANVDFPGVMLLPQVLPAETGHSMACSTAN